MEIYGNLDPKMRPCPGSDPYKETYRILKVFMAMINNFITGKYINFAISEYYHDNSFA